MHGKRLDSLIHEDQLFSPSQSFQEDAVIQSNKVYEDGQDTISFWERQAERITWFKPWEQTLDWRPPYAKWFVEGKLNASYNCIDRHLQDWHRNKAAIIFEGENGENCVLTYQDLHREVSKLANVLKSLGVNKGDSVTIYLPMIPEAVISMLACARIGAPHSVVFGGFSSDALRDRVLDAQSSVVITADGGFRRGNIVPLKENADIALKEVSCVEHVVVVNRTGHSISMVDGRDLWYHEIMKKASTICPAEPMDAEDMLFILYTSGTTGKPKGVVHTTGGYMVGVSTTHQWIFDIKEEDVYWCTADVGWITGHSYIVYGPLANGSTIVLYEGSPDYPNKDRYWEIIDKYQVSILYTAPTAIRTFMKWGPKYPESHNLSSLRLLGTVGEPINPEAWKWYHKYIGRERCPIVDTWWQTETGMIMISPLPGITALKPGSCTVPFPGVKIEVVDHNGNPLPKGSDGYLVIREPWPAMLRTIYRDSKRFKETYFGNWPGVYFTGDGAKWDDDGYYWISGRVDDVINVSGHRIGTMEVESALVDHPFVAEAACIGKSHEVKGQALAAFVTLKEGFEASPGLEYELKSYVAKKIGALARPENILFTAELPKTRSGKIIRRLLRDIAEGRALGDITTLADVSVVNFLKA
jgi:acetyl-CoA synthetase